MIKRSYILMLASMLAVGCSETTSTVPMQAYEGEVKFTLDKREADWATRGASINSVAEIPSVGVYSVANFGAADRALYINNLQGVLLSGTTWHFDPAMYYPKDKSLKCFAYVPYGTGHEHDGTGNGITTSFDLTNEQMRINYFSPAVDVRNQPDLLVATSIGSGEGGLTFDYQHALTKITLSAKLTGTHTANKVEDPVTHEMKDPEFYITKFTLQHVAIEGHLDISADTDGKINFDSKNDSGEWEVYQLSRTLIIASNAYILPDPTGEYGKHDENLAVKLNNTEYQNVMLPNQAIFALPQRIESLPATLYPHTPTIIITIYEAVTDTYYRTSTKNELDLKTPNGEGFKMGQHINLQFAFDIDANGNVIDMSLVPEIREWDKFDVEVDVDPNIYIVLDSNEIVNNEVLLYTNSAVKPVVTSDKVANITVIGTPPDEAPGAHTIVDAQLTEYKLIFDTSTLADGEIVKISVVGYADGANSPADEAANKPNETKITKEFNLTIKR